jgi:hypothetical protein
MVRPGGRRVTDDLLMRYWNMADRDITARRPDRICTRLDCVRAASETDRIRQGLPPETVSRQLRGRRNAILSDKMAGLVVVLTTRP